MSKAFFYFCLVTVISMLAGCTLPTNTPKTLPTMIPTSSPTATPTAKPTATPTIAPTASPTPAPIVMVNIPAGSFSNGTGNVTMSVFTMSATDITRSQWTTVTAWTDPSSSNFSSGINDPVQMVNWYQAIAFCNKLSLKEGLTPVYSVSGVDFSTLVYSGIPTISDAVWDAVTINTSADGYLLPTEMQWLWAAMGATLDSKPSDGFFVSMPAVYNALCSGMGCLAIAPPPFLCPAVQRLRYIQRLGRTQCHCSCSLVQCCMRG